MERRQNIKSRKDISGQVFGRLTAVQRLDSTISPRGKLVSLWLCKCSCGNEARVVKNSLTSGRSRSCGCLNRDTGRMVGLYINKSHGGASLYASVDEHIRFQILQHIRRRARNNGYETDLCLSDIPEPGDVCPVLGTKFKKAKGPLSDSSVSVDKINPNLPYLKKYVSNLRLISYRANRIKNDASIDELKKVLQYYVENSTQSHSEGSEKSSLVDSNPETGTRGKDNIQPERLSEKTLEIVMQ